MNLRGAFLGLLAGNILVTVANLLRDVTLAGAFGAGVESDVLFLAISIPVFLVTVGTGAFRSIVVPALGRAIVSTAARFQALANRFLLVAVVVTAGIVMALALLAFIVYQVDLPNVAHESRRLFASFLAAILPMYFFTAIVELVQGPLQVCGRYFIPNVLRLGLPLGIVAAIVMSAHPSVFTVSLGGGTGALIAMLSSAWLLRQNAILPTARTSGLPDDVGKAAVSGYYALVAATLITYANPLVDQWIAGFAGHGATSMLGYANRLMTGVAGLVAGAVSQTLVIHFSRLLGAGNKAGVNAAYRLVVRITPWVGCLATLAVWLTSQLAVSLIYQRGRFDASDAAAVADLIDRYAMQFPVYWTGIAAFTLVWATSMNQIFVRIGVVLFVTNVIGDLLFLKLFGVRGIPLTTVVVYALSTLLLNISLHRAGHVAIPPIEWLRALVPVCALALSWQMIHALRLGASLTSTPLANAQTLAMFAAFSGITAMTAFRAFKQHRAAVAT